MASTIDTPIMPILPATATIVVRFIFESRFLSDSINAIPNDIEERFFLPLFIFTSSAEADCSSSTPSYGLLSSVT